MAKHLQLLHQAREFLHGQQLRRNAQIQIVLDLDLAAQAHVAPDLGARQMHALGGERRARARAHLDLAVAARPLAAAGAGDEDFPLGQGHEQIGAAPALEAHRRIMVDLDFADAVVGNVLLGDDQD